MQNPTVIRVALAVATLFGLSLFAYGCSDTNEPETGTGTLRVSLVDMPNCVDGLEHLYLVLEDVRVHRSADGEDDDGGWASVLPETFTIDERTVDLLQLVDGVFAVIGLAELPAGSYSQVRLVLEESWMVVDGETLGLKVPSGSQSGLKLIHGFTVEPGVITDLVIDWDACRSLVETPPGSERWNLKPTLRVMTAVVSGSISGEVLPLDIGAAVLAVSSDLADTAVTMVDPIDGGYMLAPLRQGAWDVTAFAPGYKDSTVVDVSVVAGQENVDNDFTLEIIER